MNVPEYVIRAERQLWDWGTSSPVDCMVASEERPPERKLEIFESELQYHLGAFVAAEHICNSLYKIEGLDRNCDEHHPPWMGEAIEYQERLRERVDSSNDSKEES